MLKTIHIVGMGMGPTDMGPAAIRILEAADVLAGGKRQLESFPDHPAERLEFSSPLDGWTDRIVEAARERRVVVLASGDPNFYGIAGRLLEKAGAENVRIHPNVTAVQAAFARLKQPWHDAAVVSLHGRDAGALYTALFNRTTVAVFTDPKNTPARIARMLLDRELDDWRMAVLENLGQPDVRISHHRPQEAVNLDFEPLNIVVLSRKEPPTRLKIGAPDEDYEHEAGLITKAEVRAVVLAKLSLGPGQTLWDLGAGCGSVGLEALLLMPGGRVEAVERREERAAQIRANRTRFGASPLTIHVGEIMEAMDRLPDPDRVFIGGGGSDLEAIVQAAGKRLKPGGVLTASVVRLESLEAARRALAALGREPEVVQVQVSRGAPLGGDAYFKAGNPVFIVTGRFTAKEEPV